MVRHNNVLPNVHLHKDWERFVKTWFNQPAKKNQRRIARKKKAAKLFPRPAQGLLRPVVRCPTIKYNSKLRLGRGFTTIELKKAGIQKKQALGLGISIDYRRTNKSEPIFLQNIKRLKEYKARLVIFPRKKSRRNVNKKTKKLPKPKTAQQIERKSVRDIKNAKQYKKPLIPLRKPDPKKSINRRRISKKMLRGPTAYATLRMARGEARLVGIRKKKAAQRQALAEVKKKE